MQRLLITGVDTMLGANLALALASRCQVTGLYEHTAVRCDMVDTAPWSSCAVDELEPVVRAWQPDWLIHCGPLAAASWEPDPPATAMAAETEVVTRLAALAQRHSVLLTVISSDAVLSGPRMFAEENCQIACDTPRASATLAMERAAGDEALVIRTHAYGWSPAGRGSTFAERMYRQLQSGPVTEAANRRYATPLLATDLAERLWQACNLRLRGLYHMAGAERTSTQRFICELAKDMGGALAPTLHAFCDSSLHEETSLSSRRAKRALGIAPPMLREGLERFVAQASSGWRQAWQDRGPVTAVRIAA